MQLEKTDLIVLDFMIQNYGKEYSIKELSDSLKRPYVKVHKSVQRLLSKKIITQTIKGKSHYCKIDYDNNLDVAIFISYQRTRKFLDENKKIMSLTVDILGRMDSPNFTLAVFGQGLNEMAIITSQEDKERGRVLIESLRPRNLRFHHFTYNELLEMLRSRKPNLAKKIIENNIILKGCEQYYECLRMAQ